MTEPPATGGAASGSQPATIPCPKCHAPMPVYEGYRTWCSQCGHNLGAPDVPPRRPFMQRLFAAWAKRQNQSQFYQALRLSSLPTRQPQLPRLAAYLVAGLVHSLTVGFFTVGIWLIFFTHPLALPFRILFGSICFALSWVVFPRIHFSSPRDPLPRERFPGLYGLADQTARALDCPPVTSIVTSNTFNAAMVRVKLSRAHYLDLGLPLLVVLSPQERVALIAHELAHTMVGDPFEQLFIRTAMDSLRSWGDVLRPSSMPFLTAILFFPITIIRYLFIYVVQLFWYVLLALLWGTSQLSEYSADLLGARVGGTVAQLGVLRKVPVGDSLDTWEYAARVDRTGATFFVDLCSRFERVPEREYERLRRVQEAARNDLATTHPPVALRQEFLHTNYVHTPAYVPAPETLAQVESELQWLCQQAQARMFGIASQKP